MLPCNAMHFVYIWHPYLLKMKKVLLLTLLLTGFVTKAQEECEYSVITTDTGEIKSTVDYLMYEKVFAGTSSFIFFSLSNHEGIPILNFQLLAKSNDFPKVYCLDKNSRIHLQLANGKIATLISVTEDNCSGLVYDSNENKNLRMLSGMFAFTKGSLENLEQSPITFMRVKYNGEMVDYPVKSTLQSETMAKTYTPERYFMDNLKCIK